jgi:hypothetical protein
LSLFQKIQKRDRTSLDKAIAVTRQLAKKHSYHVFTRSAIKNPKMGDHTVASSEKLLKESQSLTLQAKMQIM